MYSSIEELNLFLVAFLQGRLFGYTAGTSLKILLLLLTFINRPIDFKSIHSLMKQLLGLYSPSPENRYGDSLSPSRTFTESINYNTGHYGLKHPPHFLLGILFETFAEVCFTKWTLHVSEFSLPAKSSQIPPSPFHLFQYSCLITATGDLGGIFDVRLLTQICLN